MIGGMRYALPMPTFDFQCAKCKTVFEFTRPFGSSVNPPCTKCKSKKTAKLFTTPTIVFKGEGWYKTEGRKEPKEAKATEAHKEKKTDTKTPETKTEKPKPE